MKLLAILLTIISTITVQATDETDKTNAINQAKCHLIAVICADTDVLKTTFSDTIQLMPGHEFLKKEYKLTDKGTRKTGAIVKRDQLLKVLTKEIGNKPKPLVKTITTQVNTFNFEILKTKEGDYKTDSSDPVGTPDKMLHFQIKKGDILIKASPKRGDFLLFQMRKEDDKWKVVAEYLD